MKRFKRIAKFGMVSALVSIAVAATGCSDDSGPSYNILIRGATVLGAVNKLTVDKDGKETADPVESGCAKLHVTINIFGTLTKLDEYGSDCYPIEGGTVAASITIPGSLVDKDFIDSGKVTIFTCSADIYESDGGKLLGKGIATDCKPEFKEESAIFLISPTFVWKVKEAAVSTNSPNPSPSSGPSGSPPGPAPSDSGGPSASMQFLLNTKHPLVPTERGVYREFRPKRYKAPRGDDEKAIEARDARA